MPLACISSILFTSDAFWGNTPLKSLRHLLSTSKELHRELTVPYDGKKSPSLTEHALLMMMRQRPRDLRGWRLTFEDAGYCFALRTAVMIKHNRGLPPTDAFYMSDFALDLVRRGRKRGYIRFIDAFRLTIHSKSGLAAAMERRRRVDMQVLETAQNIVPQMVRMLHGVDITLNKAVEALTERIKYLDATVKTRSTVKNILKRVLRLIEKLRDYAFLVRFDLKYTKTKLLEGDAHTLELKKLVQELKFKRNSITARYKAYSVHCPEQMTMDCFEDQ